MGSSGKKRTTMAKLNRESKLRDKRSEKQARKAARRSAAAHDATEASSRPEDLGEALRDGVQPESVAARGV